MKRTTLIILLATICYFASSAQTPGYMGLKSIFKYSASVPVGITQPKYSFVVSHKGSFEYVVKKNNSIIVHYQYLNKKNITQSDEDAYYYDYFYNNNGEEEVRINSKKFDYSSHTIGFTYRAYPSRRNAIAPLGTYIGVGVGVILPSAKLHMEGTVEDYGGVDNGDFRDKTVNESYIDAFFGIEFGRQYIIKNRLVIDFGARVNVPFVSIIKNVKYDIYGDDIKDVYTAGLTTQIFQLNLGIGVLLW